ncbi:hypothetical protein ACFQY5_08510 [Paeniroseomonas aquatica]|uniref:hypothetical protein n=1 Tax=Paeniroseomonas aquatica TaxID=373043 RepID=UPI003613F219
MHEQSKAAKRRIADAAFVTRYMAGEALDIGAGPDGLARHVGVFPASPPSANGTCRMATRSTSPASPMPASTWSMPTTACSTWSTRGWRCPTGSG